MKHFLLLTLAAPLLSSCQHEEAQEAHHEESESQTLSNRIEIPATVRANLGISFAKVERRMVAKTLRVPGSFELEPLATREYRLPIPGTVSLAVKPFQEVAPGELLFRVRSTSWIELQSQIDLSRASLNEAQVRLEATTRRLKALSETGFQNAQLSAENLRLQADVQKQEAILNAALSKAHRILSYHDDSISDFKDLLKPLQPGDQSVLFYQSIDWLDVRCAEGGIVDQIELTNGSFAEETSHVLSVVDPQKLRFRATILQADLQHISATSKAQIVLPQAKDNDPNEAIKASLTLGIEANSTERTFPVIALPQEQKPWAKPGVSAFLEIVLSSTNNPVLAIPRSAVVQDELTYVFFKRDPLNPNKAIREEADLGVNDGRWIEIKSGLGPKDEVVLDGVYELKLASSQSGANQKGGHFHADGTFHADDH